MSPSRVEKGEEGVHRHISLVRSGMCSPLTQFVRAGFLHYPSVVACEERKNNDAKNYRKADASGSILSADVNPSLTFKCLW